MRNMLFITVDCLRYDVLTKNLHILPNFNSIIENGQLVKCYTIGTCTPLVFPGVWTSTYPSMCRGTFDISRRGETFFQILKKNGYFTLGISDGNSFLSRKFNYHLIFDEWIDFLDRYTAKDRVTKIRTMIERPSFFSDPKELFKIMLRKIKGKKKWAVWIHLMNLHGPHFSPGNNLIKRLIEVIAQWKIRRKPGIFSSKIIYSAYLNTLKYVDSSLRFILKRIQNKKVVLFIFGDHGESLGEKNVYGHNHGIPYKEIIEVPLITNLKSPRINGPVSLIDFVPSILDLCGIKPTKKMIGKNFFRTKRQFFFIEGYPIKLKEVPSKIKGKTIPCVIYNRAKLWISKKANFTNEKDISIKNPSIEGSDLKRLVKFRKMLKSYTMAP